MINELVFFSKSDDKEHFKVLPVQISYRFNPSNVNYFGDRLMVPAAGHQAYVSAGFYAKFGILNLQFQPEFVIAENRAYDGFPQLFNPQVTFTRFIYWNNGDYPERFGDDVYSKFWWGQTKIALTGKNLEFYAGTQNITWGPGQFNSLIFSSNAPGFPHLSLNTVNPLNTIIGSFEGQLIVGRLENSFLEPSQNSQQNEVFFTQFESDWRYLNGFTLSYQPKWLDGVYVGINRTFQVNNNLMGDTFRDYFPIFEIFQKEEFFENGNSSAYDEKGTDQQVSVFSRIVSRKAMAEVYFEYGRRDHAFNWREFTLNPEHARAYLVGFQKLVRLNSKYKFLQIRGEIVKQQESVNRYIRYIGLGGNLTWHTHGTARGFTNFGQALGVGTGVGSNSQIMEFSIVSNKNKKGILFSRLENNQDFFYRAFGQNPEKSPWVDFSLAFIWEQQWNKLMLSANAQITNGVNHQWQSNSNSTSDFPSGKNLFSFSSSVNLIYQIGR
ncbi:MAG: capsule assembly Wzi family protein [Algoriphagus sp.]|nr:capsule assembly Wzi family protein [Algoriphagus sp.]